VVEADSIVRLAAALSGKEGLPVFLLLLPHVESVLDSTYAANGTGRSGRRGSPAMVDASDASQTKGTNRINLATYNTRSGRSGKPEEGAQALGTGLPSVDSGGS